jgi:putative hemolysin
VALLAACAPPDLGTSTQPTQEAIGMPNPASKYCVDQGFKLEMRKDAQGNEYGVCIFDDGSECDEWAFFRGECGQDKVKQAPSTYLANPAAVFCDEQGYRYETRKDDQGNEYGVCIFDDNVECDAWAFFRGECGANYAKNLTLNVVEAAGLAETVQIDVLAPKTSSVDPDASREPRQPGMEVVLTITDPEDIRALVSPLDTALPLEPPLRCPALYELQFHLKNGDVQAFQVGVCNLYGPQNYWRGLTIRPPDDFANKFSALLKEAGIQR